MGYNTSDHRTVEIRANLSKEHELLFETLVRAIGSVSTLFVGNAGKINKRWYCTPIYNKANVMIGEVWFTATNKAYRDRKTDIDKILNPDYVEYRLHIKMHEIVGLGCFFTSASMYFNTRRGDLAPDRVTFNTYAGSDPVSTMHLKNLIWAQGGSDVLKAFTPTNDNVMAQADVTLTPLLTLDANGQSTY